MSGRFEMPVGPDAVRGYNLFELDDFLRSIQTSEARQALARRAGFSRAQRDAYEKKRGLPHGAVELALMLEDRRMGEINAMLRDKFPELYHIHSSWERIFDLQQQLQSIAIGLRATYPDATGFLMTYAQLADRTRRSFVGDYRFSNEYRLMLAADGGQNPPPNNSPTAWTYQAVYIAAFANAVVVANAFVWANALVVTLAALALAAVAVVGPVVPTLYGPKLGLRHVDD